MTDETTDTRNVCVRGEFMAKIQVCLRTFKFFRSQTLISCVYLDCVVHGQSNKSHIKCPRSRRLWYNIVVRFSVLSFHPTIYNFHMQGRCDMELRGEVRHESPLYAVVIIICINIFWRGSNVLQNALLPI